MHTQLYNRTSDFQLGDCGLSNMTAIAATTIDHLHYTAPEMSQKGQQTHKKDIQSLLIIIIWTLNVSGF